MRECEKCAVSVLEGIGTIASSLKSSRCFDPLPWVPNRRETKREAGVVRTSSAPPTPGLGASHQRHMLVEVGRKGGGRTFSLGFAFMAWILATNPSARWRTPVPSPTAGEASTAFGRAVLHISQHTSCRACCLCHSLQTLNIAWPNYYEEGRGPRVLPIPCYVVMLLLQEETSWTTLSQNCAKKNRATNGKTYVNVTLSKTSCIHHPPMLLQNC